MLHERAVWDGRLCDPGFDPAKASELQACVCGGEAAGDAGDACGVCGGCGVVARGEPVWDDRLIEEVGLFLMERASVEKHGLAAWMVIHGVPDAWFLAGLECFEGAWNRADVAERQGRAKMERERAGVK